MKGPYLPIWKRKTIFFSMTKNSKKMHILKKESNNFLNIPISWHFNEHARYPTLYFNKSKLSIHVGNSQPYSDQFGSSRLSKFNFFKREDNVGEELKITTSCRSNETERN